MHQYYQVFTKALLSQAQLWDFYHPSARHKNGELLLVTVGTVLASYAIHKYVK